MECESDASNDFRGCPIYKHSSPFAKSKSKTEPPASRNTCFSHSQPTISSAAYLYPYTILSWVQRYTVPLRDVEIIGEITSERGGVDLSWWG